MASYKNDAQSYIHNCPFITPAKQKNLASVCAAMKMEKKEDLTRLTSENVRDLLTERELEKFKKKLEKDTAAVSYTGSSVNALIHATGNAKIGAVSFSDSAIAIGSNAQVMYIGTSKGGVNSSALYKPLIDAKIPPMWVKEVIRTLRAPPFQIEYLDDFREMDDEHLEKLESEILPEGAQRKKFMRFVREHVKDKGT